MTTTTPTVTMPDSSTGKKMDTMSTKMDSSAKKMDKMDKKMDKKMDSAKKM